MLRTFAAKLRPVLRPVVNGCPARTFSVTAVKFNVPQISEEEMLQNLEKLDPKLRERFQTLDPESKASLLKSTHRGQGYFGNLEEHDHIHAGEDLELWKWRYMIFFSNPANDGWLARQAMNDLMQQAAIPEPEVTIEVLKCCRRMNDYALSVRYLESLKFMMQNQVKAIWPWYLQEIQPTLTELGILTPEEMGYDKPELFLEEAEDMH